MFAPPFRPLDFVGSASGLHGLDRDRKAFNRTAVRAFERADVETPRSRFDIGKPHRLAALGTGQDSDFSATE